MAQGSELIQLLNQWRTGDEALMEQIVPAVCDELHRVAASYMRHQPQHTLLKASLAHVLS